MSPASHLSFSSRSAHLQYRLLMALFTLAMTRGLYGRFARGLGRVFPAQNWACVHDDGCAPFRVRLNDGYWTRFLLYQKSYEPEVASILTAARGQTPLFCDLGANTGYWTTRAAPHFPRIIAVEAATQTYAQLIENTRVLPNVTVHHAAIFDHAGATMSFVNVHNSHASARLRQDSPPDSADRLETVTTTTIDTLIPDDIPALIKLDVEGAEIAAFQGGRRALQNGAVCIYEDHGGDESCAPTAYLLGLPDICVYAIDGQTITPIKTCAAAHAVKTDRFKGYNFLAAHKASPLLAHIMARMS